MSQSKSQCFFIDIHFGGFCQHAITSKPAPHQNENFRFILTLFIQGKPFFKLIWDKNKSFHSLAPWQRERENVTSRRKIKQLSPLLWREKSRLRRLTFCVQYMKSTTFSLLDFPLWHFLMETFCFQLRLVGDESHICVSTFYVNFVVFKCLQFLIKAIKVFLW